LLSDAPFLVLDEPTSALDPEQERKLIDTLHRLKGSRTIILVTHRLESVVDCDCIYVMKKGEIIERGAHDDLIASGGAFSKAWRRPEAAE
jgi:subfamily B ATP-binding cassette protein MsbA